MHVSREELDAFAAPPQLRRRTAPAPSGLAAAVERAEAELGGRPAPPPLPERPAGRRAPT